MQGLVNVLVGEQSLSDVAQNGVGSRISSRPVKKTIMVTSVKTTGSTITKGTGH